MNIDCEHSIDDFCIKCYSEPKITYGIAEKNLKNILNKNNNKIISWLKTHYLWVIGSIIVPLIIFGVNKI